MKDQFWIESTIYFSIMANHLIAVMSMTISFHQSTGVLFHWGCVRTRSSAHLVCVYISLCMCFINIERFDFIKEYIYTFFHETLFNITKKEAIHKIFIVDYCVGSIVCFRCPYTYIIFQRSKQISSPSIFHGFFKF